MTLRFLIEGVKKHKLLPLFATAVISHLNVSDLGPIIFEEEKEFQATKQILLPITKVR